MKIALLAVAIVGLMVRGYFMYQANQIQAAKQTLSTRQTVDKIRHDMQGPDAAADAAARGKPDGPSRPSAATTPADAPIPSASAAPVAAGTPAASAAQHQEIEASLKTLHLTTIMPGQPGIVIIDKKEYSEGEEIPLDKGRKARIVTVQDDGVALTCNGMAFYLDAPGAPDLAASRKKK